MESDQIYTIGSSIIQHGKVNDRIYLMKLAVSDLPFIIGALDDLAFKNNYGKIFAKVPENQKEVFVHHGYTAEAFIPRFYEGMENVIFMGKFFSKSRAIDKRTGEINKILAACNNRKDRVKDVVLGEEYDFRICGEKDALEMASLYQKVFATYPFPIFDYHYIVKTMRKNIVYFGIWYKEKLVALSSAEMDREAGNAEMTDFATLPSHRGRNLALFLLSQMEEEMKKRKIKTTYSIARAYSWGMNLTFAKFKYRFTGTLLNNTNIGGSLESMNVWYKNLF